MILLTGTNDAVVITPSSTQVLHIQASYVDLNGSTVTPGRTNTIYSTASQTNIVGSPASSTQRTVKFLSIQNTGASAETITVGHTDGSTLVQLQKISLTAGYTLVYNEGSGWTLYDSSGNIQTSVGPGRFIKTTVLTTTSNTAFTTQTTTNTLRVRMVGAGGQGGGSAATTGEHGSGGGSGSYAEWTGTVSPSTAYYYTAGAAGSGGAAGANGGAGANTIFTVGATIITAYGGSGGIVGNSATVPRLGGAGGIIATNGTLNLTGHPGFAGVMSATVGHSGMGGASMLGPGGQEVLFGNTAGNQPSGYGGGGSGGASTGTAEAGGSGAQGCVIIDEYS